MLKIENLVTPSPEVFQAVIRGMRLPYKSGNNSDSIICNDQEQDKEACFKGCPYVDHWEGEEPYAYPICITNLDGDKELFVLGEKDKKLLLNLCRAGDPSHRKVLRQLPVIMNIKAPLFWWKQMDKYQVGTVTNSESTMHSLVKYPFKLEDFSLGELDDTDYYIESGWLGIELNNYVSTTLELLNALRDRYIETKDVKYWNAINKLLPQSYNQTRCWSGNYETLVNILNQRRGHRLDEWYIFINYMMDNVPYLKEIMLEVYENRTRNDG